MEGTECTKGSSQTGREWLKPNDMVHDCNVGVRERRKREIFFFVFVVAKTSVLVLMVSDRTKAFFHVLLTMWVVD